ncbi:MAG TPA: hypothetical protein VMG58_16305 [Candidatus Sulfotelmatobacter sp.]|nr:hypothetical protein [Candidatus Sulfotelmatobacter sp.]
MQRGTIRRRGATEAIGRWRADTTRIEIETDDAELRIVADEVLTRPQTIPVHGADHLGVAAEAVPLVAPPARISLLALVALELESRGFAMEPDEDSEP